jgi:AAA15 family ATPase/GTPase
VIDKRQVYEEWLFEIGHQLEIPIFERSPNGINFNFAYEDLSAIAKPELIYEANHTRKNLLFITNCKEQEIKQFEFIYEWFDEILNIILPNSKPLSLTIQSNTDFEIFFKHILIHFDLGIKDIYFKPINFEKEIHYKVQKEIIKNFPYGENKVCFVAISDYLIIKEDNLGQLQASKLITTRNDEDNHNIAFEILEESDGTQRLVDLIPMLIGLSQAKVFVIDEIENSLHALIIKQLFDFILNSNFFINIKSQLIATTHEIFLLDIKKLFRKDEIWFMKKHQNRESRIYSLAYADIEKLDLMKGYINGRFGAIPFIPNIKELNWNT